MKPNVIEIENGAIVIQACDETSAHVGVFLGKSNTYHHVSIPDLVREWKLVKYNELRPVEFDRILQENKSVFLETVQRLI